MANDCSQIILNPGVLGVMRKPSRKTKLPGMLLAWSEGTPPRLPDSPGVRKRLFGYLDISTVFLFFVLKCLFDFVYLFKPFWFVWNTFDFFA